jgi:hypothetical protein
MSGEAERSAQGHAQAALLFPSSDVDSLLDGTVDGTTDVSLAASNGANVDDVLGVSKLLEW